MDLIPFLILRPNIILVSQMYGSGLRMTNRGTAVPIIVAVIGITGTGLIVPALSGTAASSCVFYAH
jgi:hypothetical protein